MADGDLMPDDAKGFAAMFDGRAYRNEVSATEAAAMKERGLVAVFGASDDLMEFRGAINDEVGCYGEGEALITQGGLIHNRCGNEDCPYFADERSRAHVIKVSWWEGEHLFCRCETSIPHEQFEIMEDGEVYCVGIVFSLFNLENANG